MYDFSSSCAQSLPFIFGDKTQYSSLVDLERKGETVREILTKIFSFLVPLHLFQHDLQVSFYCSRMFIMVIKWVAQGGG